jgi:hypothetical protein
MDSGMLRVVMIATPGWAEVILTSHCFGQRSVLLVNDASIRWRPKPGAAHFLIRTDRDSSHCFLIIMPHQMTGDWLPPQKDSVPTVPSA